MDQGLKTRGERQKNRKKDRKKDRKRKRLNHETLREERKKKKKERKQRGGSEEDKVSRGYKPCRETTRRLCGAREKPAAEEPAGRASAAGGR